LREKEDPGRAEGVPSTWAWREGGRLEEEEEETTDEAAEEEEGAEENAEDDCRQNPAAHPRGQVVVKKEGRPREDGQYASARVFAPEQLS